MCYRYEPVTDAAAEMMFQQVEGMAVGEHITMADLKGTIIAFTRRMFGPDRTGAFARAISRSQSRASKWTWTRAVCGGQGLQLCANERWAGSEILGAGMVHPVVLRNGGYDPAQFSGFAFGMGPQRITMLKYAIDDIRQFWQNDLRLLEAVLMGIPRERRVLLAGCGNM